MRKIFFSMFTTLDGFIEGPNGELDWAIVDEELHTYINKRTILYRYLPVWTAAV
jgi:hypothetical protein